MATHQGSRSRESTSHGRNIAIKHWIKALLKQVIPQRVKAWIINDEVEGGQIIYSQEGEDMLLFRLVKGKRDGLFVDIGAHQPKRLSNTYLFYKLGWRGINVDVMPGSMKAFDDVCPADCNVEAAVSDKREELEHYIFSHHELNTFSKQVELYMKCEWDRLREVRRIRTTTLSQVLDEHMARFGGKEIDFLSIDVEGLDLNVIRSNNWETYRPRYVLAEDLLKSVVESNRGPIAEFLNQVGYTMIAKTCNTIVFKRNDVPLEL